MAWGIKSFGRDFPFRRQQFAALLGNTRTSVKFICIAVPFFYGLPYSEIATIVLSITPDYLLPLAFWIRTAFTSCFWEVCVDRAPLGCQMITFFAIVNFGVIGVVILLALFYTILYMCTGNTDLISRFQKNWLSDIFPPTAAVVVKWCQIVNSGIMWPENKKSSRLIRKYRASVHYSKSL